MGTVASYAMNPAEDTVIFGDELAEDMWVIPEMTLVRSSGGSEDDRLRGERFRRVTKLRIQPARGETPALTVFIGEWVDGYQAVHSFAVTHGWIVKKAAQSETGGAS